MLAAFSTSINALRANQVALDTIANNIANAGTEGYHRQEVRFADRAGYRVGEHWIGSGVDADYILRSFNSVVETSFRENESLEASVSERLLVLKQVETILGPGEGSLNGRLSNFFSDLRGLQAEPDNISKRNITIGKLQALTDEIDTISSRITVVEKEVGRQIHADVEKANGLLDDLFTLNKKIKSEQSLGRRPNGLLDQFYQKSTELSKIIDVQTIEADGGGFSFQVSGGQFFFSNSEFQIEARGSAFEPTSIYVADSDIELHLNGGSLQGFQRLKNVEFARVREQINTFTGEFIFGLDQLHATGLPLSGGFDVLNSTRSVSNTSDPLSETVALGTLSSGSLFVSITDNVTGERTLEEISFDPATQSLDDLATALSLISNLDATVSPGSGKINIYGSPGFQFDFAGRLPTYPDASGLTGTSVPTASGEYTGENNDTYSFAVVGTGTVGVTDGLELQVTNTAGDILGSFSVGTDYEPGSEIEIANGVKISLDSGTVVNGESFSLRSVQQADETGVLGALGINSLFTGSGPNSIAVRKDVLNDPSQFALGRNGNTGDAGNLNRFLQLQDAENVGGLSLNFETYTEQITISIAREVNQLSDEQLNYELVGEQLKKEIDSISGVDPNEEMVFLLQYQKAYEASVRVISTLDQILTDLFSIR